MKLKVKSQKEKVLSGRWSVAGAVLFFLFTVHCSMFTAYAQTTEFTYQGRLLDNTMPPTANYDFQFSLWDALANGTQIGTTQPADDVAVANGIFTVRLNFGPTAFTGGAARFLQIEVRPGASTGAYTTLAPRQPVTSTPYAVKALKSNDSDNLGGVAASEYVTTTNGGNSFIRNDNTVTQTANFNISGDGVFGGNVGIATIPTPGFKLDVFGSGRFLLPNGNINFGSPNAETGITIGTGSNGNRADVRFNGTTLVMAAGIGTGVPGNTGVAVDTAGNVGLGGLPQNGIRLNSVGIGRFQFPTSTIQFGTPNGETGMTITGSNRADIRFNNTTLTIAAGTGTGIPNNFGLTVNTAGNVGIGIASPTTRLDVAGTVKTSILQITGGSDLAESFEIDGIVKPGMIVAINPNNSGKLVLARGAHNRRVVGVISGANNLAAGMLLPNLDKTAASIPVALSGRVWVYADATRNPIRAGDLLTTSARPGHAMKVIYYRKAQGAIIGKAMSQLKSGTGLILVLVNLQ